jgi:DNA repair exonuclease SbcCD nuclease subunit
LGASLRFIHTADIHLGAPFKRVGAEDADVRRRLLEASQVAFERVVDAAIAHDVDFVVIAGDALDGTEKRPAAELFLMRQMERLDEHGIAVYSARGNHDAEDCWSASIDLPANVRFFDSAGVERVVHEREGEPVCVLYGRSYPVRRITENYASEYQRDDSDILAVGVLHTNVGGREGFEDYAPCSVDDLRAAGMDYWALGHVHGHEVVADDPLAVYAGSPQGLDPNEAGDHGFVLVEVTDGVPRTAFHSVAPMRWERFGVDVSSATSIDDVAAYVTDHLAQTASSAGTSGTIARVTLSGRSAAHPALSGEAAAADLLEHVRERSSGLSPWVWVDRIDDDTSGLLDTQALAQSEGFLGDVIRRADSLDAQSAVDDALTELRSKLAAFPEPDLTSEQIVTKARDACLDLLTDEGGTQ